MNTKRILVVDDDQRIRELLTKYFTEQGFEVFQSEDGQSLTEKVQKNSIDLVILDYMMPNENGQAALQKLRTAQNLTPVIMLTAKQEEIDKILMLEFGADDYITKPFNPRELMARINAILRRSGQNEIGNNKEHAKVNFGDFVVDSKTRQLFKHGLEQSLTTSEFELLWILVSRPERVLTRDNLMEMTRGRRNEAFDRVIDVQISRLRKIIEENPEQPKHIRTIWGKGYVFYPNIKQTIDSEYQTAWVKK